MSTKTLNTLGLTAYEPYGNKEPRDHYYMEMAGGNFKVFAHADMRSDKPVLDISLFWYKPPSSFRPIFFSLADGLGDTTDTWKSGVNCSIDYNGISLERAIIAIQAAKTATIEHFTS